MNKTTIMKLESIKELLSTGDNKQIPLVDICGYLNSLTAVIELPEEQIRGRINAFITPLDNNLDNIKFGCAFYSYEKRYDPLPEEMYENTFCFVPYYHLFDFMQENTEEEDYEDSDYYDDDYDN